MPNGDKVVDEKRERKYLMSLYTRYLVEVDPFYES